jgi:hypothetical protein
MDEAENNDSVMADARMGIRIEEFLASDVGRYLIDRAEMEESAAIEDLLSAKDGSHESLEARGKVGLARMFRAWLIEGVEAGISATLNLRIMETEIDDND